MKISTMEPRDSFVWHADWDEVAQTIENKILRCVFYEIIHQYGLKGMIVEVPPELKIAFELIKRQIDRDREKYDIIKEKRREAINKRWQREKQKDDDIQNIQMNTNVSDSVPVPGVLINQDFKNPPIAPQGAKGGAGASSFEDFFNRVKSIQIPKRVQDEHYTAQYVWRMAEGNPGYGLAVNKAVAAAQSREEFVQAMQNINSRFKASGDFQAVKLALAMMRCNPQQQAAVIAEAKRAAGEADLWKTLLAKVEYINNGNKVSSLAGFFKSRQTK